MNVMIIITNREVEFKDISKGRNKYCELQDFKGDYNTIHHQINSHYFFKLHSHNVQIRLP